MKSIPKYNFYKKKYGDELLIDVIELQSIKNSIEKTPVHIVTYYDITFITEGIEDVALNDNVYNMKPGTAICSIPGEVWRWEKMTKLNGLVLVFEEEFLLSFFNDPLFLWNFAYLHPERFSAIVKMENEIFQKVVRLLYEIKTEISHAHWDQHMLRALLYEVLLLLKRSQQALPDSQQTHLNDISFGRYVERFVQLANTDFILEQRTQYYADKLFITTNYLNKLIQRRYGISTKAYLQNKIMQEAKQLLKYTTLSVSEIAISLNFKTASYFIRFFFKHSGYTPKHYRDNSTGHSTNY